MHILSVLMDYPVKSPSLRKSSCGQGRPLPQRGQVAISVAKSVIRTVSWLTKGTKESQESMAPSASSSLTQSATLKLPGGRRTLSKESRSGSGSASRSPSSVRTDGLQTQE